MASESSLQFRTVRLGSLGLSAGLIAAISAAPAAAETRFAVGVSGGTTGFTAEAQAELNSIIQLRGGYNYFQYGIDDDFDDINYDGDLDLSTFGAFADIHPFSNGFLVSGGVFAGEKKLDMTAAPSGDTVEIGDETFDADDVGTLNLVADLEDVAPFVGLGWDTTFQGDGPLGFKIILGAMFSGSPSVSLTSEGANPAIQDELNEEIEQEERNLQDDVEDYEVYPVAQIGLTFRF